jgi:hypothetical protein
MKIEKRISLKASLKHGLRSDFEDARLLEPPFTTRKVFISDDLLVTLQTLVTEWYVFHDEMSIFVIVACDNEIGERIMMKI